VIFFFSQKSRGSERFVCGNDQLGDGETSGHPVRGSPHGRGDGRARQRTAPKKDFSVLNAHVGFHLSIPELINERNNRRSQHRANRQTPGACSADQGNVNVAPQNQGSCLETMSRGPQVEAPDQTTSTTQRERQNRRAPNRRFRLQTDASNSGAQPQAPGIGDQDSPPPPLVTRGRGSVRFCNVCRKVTNNTKHGRCCICGYQKC